MEQPQLRGWLSWCKVGWASCDWVPPQPPSFRFLPRRLVKSDAAALAGQPCQWMPPDKFQRVTRSECMLGARGIVTGSC
jgi:hypothetical protein